MIARQHGHIVFECDSCNETLELDTDDFANAWEEAKHEGWSTRKIAGEWLHDCPKCGVPT